MPPMGDGDYTSVKDHGNRRADADAHRTGRYQRRGMFERTGATLLAE